MQVPRPYFDTYREDPAAREDRRYFPDPRTLAREFFPSLGRSFDAFANLISPEFIFNRDGWTDEQRAVGHLLSEIPRGLSLSRDPADFVARHSVELPQSTAALQGFVETTPLGSRGWTGFVEHLEQEPAELPLELALMGAGKAITGARRLARAVTPFDTDVFNRTDLLTGQRLPSAAEAGVSIQTYRGARLLEEASGIRVGPQTIATASHVVAGKPGMPFSPTVMTARGLESGQTGMVRGVQGIFPEADIAFLETADVSDAYLPLSDLVPGLSHEAVGDLGAGLETFSGTVGPRTYSDLATGATIGETTLSGRGGLSGAGLVGESGEVSGVYLGTLGQRGLFATGGTVSDFQRQVQGRAPIPVSQLQTGAITDAIRNEGLHYRLARQDPTVSASGSPFLLGGLALHGRYGVQEPFSLTRLDPTRHREFDEGPVSGVFAYEGDLRDMLFEIKTPGLNRNRRESLLEYLRSETQLERIPDIFREGSYDAITAVPSSVDRLRQRGFNQAEFYAEIFSDVLDIPFQRDLLRRTRQTVESSRMEGRLSREANLSGAFLADPSVAGQRILTVDDIAATGTTMRETLAALRGAGAEDVGGLAVASSLHNFMHPRSGLSRFSQQDVGNRVWGGVDFTSSQERAISHLEGPAVISAVPGAGKTDVLVERVQQLMAGGVSPSEVLTVAYNRAAIEELSSRFESAGLGATQARTVHSLAYEITMDPDNFTGVGFLHRPKIARDLTQERFRQMMRQYPDAQVDFNQSPSFEMAAAAETDADWLSAYQEYKRERGLLTFGQMLDKGAEILETQPDVHQRYLEKYPYLQIDEFQDISQREWNFLSKLTPNVLGVGDINQAIYGFRGATGDVMGDLYQGATQYHLPETFRSTPEIFQTAQRLIGLNEQQIPVQGRSVLGSGSPVDFRPTTGDTVFDELEALLGSRHTDESTAVLVSTNREIKHILNTLGEEAFENIDIGTIHKGKGQGWDRVILPMETVPVRFGDSPETIWSPRMRSEVDIENARRVGYVGLTRARQRAHVLGGGDLFEEMRTGERHLQLHGRSGGGLSTTERNSLFSVLLGSRDIAREQRIAGGYGIGGTGFLQNGGVWTAAHVLDWDDISLEEGLLFRGATGLSVQEGFEQFRQGRYAPTLLEYLSELEDQFGERRIFPFDTYQADSTLDTARIHVPELSDQFGFPLASGLDPYRARRRVLAPRTEDTLHRGQLLGLPGNRSSDLISSVLLEPGMSGGPLLGVTDRSVLGINVGYDFHGPGRKRIGFSTRMDEVNLHGRSGKSSDNLPSRYLERMEEEATFFLSQVDDFMPSEEDFRLYSEGDLLDKRPYPGGADLGPHDDLSGLGTDFYRRGNIFRRFESWMDDWSARSIAREEHQEYLKRSEYSHHTGMPDYHSGEIRRDRRAAELALGAGVSVGGSAGLYGLYRGWQHFFGNQQTATGDQQTPQQTPPQTPQQTPPSPSPSDPASEKLPYVDVPDVDMVGKYHLNIPSTPGYVDINTASVSELQQLPGVGASLANRILSYRNVMGGFSSVGELRNIRGIGDRQLSEMQPWLLAGTEGPQTAEIGVGNAPEIHLQQSPPAPELAIDYGFESLTGLDVRLPDREMSIGRGLPFGVPMREVPVNELRRLVDSDAGQFPAASPVLIDPISRGLDINTATGVELQRLPGIGQASAERIIADRQSSGAFPSLQSLSRVKGIGPATVERLSPYLRDFGLRDHASVPLYGEGASLPAFAPAQATLVRHRSLGAPLDVNTATAADFARLPTMSEMDPEITPEIAQRIIEYRNRLGGFTDVSQLGDVSGVDRGWLEDLMDTGRFEPLTAYQGSRDTGYQHPYTYPSDMGDHIPFYEDGVERDPAAPLWDATGIEEVPLESGFEYSLRKFQESQGGATRFSDPSSNDEAYSGRRRGYHRQYDLQEGLRAEVSYLPRRALRHFSRHGTDGLGEMLTSYPGEALKRQGTRVLQNYAADTFKNFFRPEGQKIPTGIENYLGDTLGTGLKEAFSNPLGAVAGGVSLAALTAYIGESSLDANYADVIESEEMREQRFYDRFREQPLSRAVEIGGKALQPGGLEKLIEGVVQRVLAEGAGEISDKLVTKIGRKIRLQMDDGRL